MKTALNYLKKLFVNILSVGLNAKTVIKNEEKYFNPWDFYLCKLICTKVKVLNFATFHMVYTPDKHKVKFDQNDGKSKSETYEVAKMLVQFKPTIICVEIVPERNEELNNDYSGF